MCGVTLRLEYVVGRFCPYSCLTINAPAAFAYSCCMVCASISETSATFFLLALIAQALMTEVRESAGHSKLRTEAIHRPSVHLAEGEGR